MPNHCDNDLRITGEKKELERFKEFAQGVSADGDVEILCADDCIVVEEIK